MGVGVERCPDIVGLFTIHIVDQQAHPHPAICRPNQAVNEQLTNRVLVEHVVLHIDASLRLLRKQSSSDKGVKPVTEEQDAGLIGTILEL